MWRKCIKNYTDNQKYLRNDGNDSKTVAGDHEDASHNSKRPLAITSKLETTGKGGRSRNFVLRTKGHSGNLSVPQLRLWARMVVTGIHNNLEEPPQVPMITRITPKRAKKEILSDALTPYW